MELARYNARRKLQELVLKSINRSEVDTAQLVEQVVSGAGLAQTRGSACAVVEYTRKRRRVYQAFTNQSRCGYRPGVGPADVCGTPWATRKLDI